ncbi:MAG: hypothetical protein ACREP9_08155, partial [Candidatus Dormibacteraceae bacterium]
MPDAPQDGQRHPAAGSSQLDSTSADGMAATDDVTSRSDAEVVAMELYAPSSGADVPRSSSEDLDPRLQLARNLDHIEDISAQLEEIHHLIDPKDTLFADPPPSSMSSDSTRAISDAAQRAPLWHDPASNSTTVELTAKNDGGRIPRPRRGGTLRRRLVPLAVAAVMVAIPALVVVATQPWRGSDNGTQSVQTGRDDVAASWAPPSDGIPGTSVAPPNAAAPPSSVVSGSQSESAKPVIGPTNERPNFPPTRTKKGEIPPLVISARVVSANPTAGKPVAFEISWKDGSGYFGEMTYTASDGTSGGLPSEMTTCQGDAPPSEGNRSIMKTFDPKLSGKQSVTFTLTTYTCDGAQEASQVTV